jgi:hypothetical protein
MVTIQWFCSWRILLYYNFSTRFLKKYIERYRISGVAPLNLIVFSGREFDIIAQPYGTACSMIPYIHMKCEPIFAAIFKIELPGIPI